MQTTQLLSTRPVNASRLVTTTCGLDTPIRVAAAAMTRADASAVLVTGPSNETIGIVTDEDFRARVVAAGEEPSRPVAAIMSAPLLRISGDALLFEAATLMRDRDVQHLVVTDALGATLGVLTGKELLQAQQHSVAMLQAEIRAATCVDELRAARSKLPFLVKSLLDGGTRVEHVTRVMTSVSDSVLLRLIEMGLCDAGPPPTRTTRSSTKTASRTRPTRSRRTSCVWGARCATGWTASATRAARAR
jgi:CBS domain-containing protein